MEIKKIIISGCSFVHGFDLCYKKHGLHPRTNWPYAEKNMTLTQMKEFEELRLSGRLKSKLGCDEFADLSANGENNDFIAKGIINYIERHRGTIDKENTIVVVGWSEPYRSGLFLDEGKLNVSWPQVSNYINVFKSEVPQDKNTVYRINVLKKLLPIEELWHTNLNMPFTSYITHCTSAYMLQLYLQKEDIKYVFFNSLGFLKPPAEGGTDPQFHYMNFNNLIDWKTWYPYGNKSSYSWTWDDDMTNNNVEKTETYHPTITAVDNFSDKLVTFIKSVL